MARSTGMLLAVALTAGLHGCTTTATSNTSRTAVEQMLVSSAIDESLDQVDFRPFRGQKVYLNDKFVECVDKNYLVASVRHRVLHAGGQLAESADASDVVVEVRSGTVGTDTSNSFVGIPEITLPGMMTTPEIRLLNRKYQSGTAKIGLVAYDPQTRTILGDGGVTLAQADDSNWFVAGIGPIRNGSIRSELRSAKQAAASPAASPLPRTVAFAAPKPGGQSAPQIEQESDIRFTGAEAEPIFAAPRSSE